MIALLHLLGPEPARDGTLRVRDQGFERAQSIERPDDIQLPRVLRGRVAEGEDFQLHVAKLSLARYNLPVIEKLRKAIRATPFVPSTVVLSDGRRLHVTSVDHVFLSPSGRSLHIYPDNDHAIWVSTQHVASIEPDQETAVP